MIGIYVEIELWLWRKNVCADFLVVNRDIEIPLHVRRIIEIDVRKECENLGNIIYSLRIWIYAVCIWHNQVLYYNKSNIPIYILHGTNSVERIIKSGF